MQFLKLPTPPPWKVSGNSKGDGVAKAKYGAILESSDFNVCFDFPLIRVAIALNTRKTEH